MVDTAIPTDATTSPADGQGFDPVLAFFESFKDAPEGPSEDKKKEAAAASTETVENPADTTEDTPPEVTEETEEDPAESETETETEEETHARDAADDDLVTVTVDGETKRVSVKELKRLFGQEAALTRKSMEVAEARKQADAEMQRYAVGLEKMAQAAAARWAEYEKIDYFQAREVMDPQAFQKLRQDAQEAYQQHQFFQQEAQAFQQQYSQAAEAAWRQAAEECRKTLEDPEKGIPGFGPEMYREICDFAVTQGADPKIISRLTDPFSFKVLHLAMKQVKAEKAAAQVRARPTVKAPTGTMKNKDAPQKEDAATKQAALAKLRQTGSPEDAANAFLANWASE